MRNCFRCAALFVVIIEACVIGEADAGPRVEVVIGADAPKLERFAADELAGQFKRLFDADVQIGATIPKDAVHLILLGSPATNPAVKSLGGAWPMLSDQGHVLRSVTLGKQAALLVGGGSSVATLWAVYELGHRFGIRSMLFGDLYPIAKPALILDGIDAVLEPTLRLRTWQTIGDSPLGPESWGLEEQQRLLRQLAKLKFNRVLLSVYPWQPFFDFEFKGVHKQIAVLWHGHRFPVDGDTSGRAVFRGAKLFENPDFSGKEAYPDRIATGVRLGRGIIDMAHELGMTAGLEVSLLELPKEFSAALPGMKPVRKSDLTFVLESKQASDEPLLIELSKTLVRASLAAYPAIDSLYLNLRDARWIPSESELRSPDGHAIELLGVSLGLTPSPRKAASLQIADITQVFEEKTVPENASEKRASASLVLPSVERTAGVLPNMPYSSLPKLVNELHNQGWAGFSTRYRNVGDLDLNTYYLARAAFDASITPQRACEELLTPICGDGIAERVLKAVPMIDQAAALVDQNAAGFDSPLPDMVMKHYASVETPPEWWGTVRDLYLNAMNEMYRANTRAREGGESYTLYLARRFEFGYEYMSCIEAVRKAGIAKAKGDRETQLAELEKAIESIDAALNAMAAIARSNSDRGLIAVLNEYAYRPLKRELEALEKTAPK